MDWLIDWSMEWQERASKQIEVFFFSTSTDRYYSIISFTRGVGKKPTAQVAKDSSATRCWFDSRLGAPHVSQTAQLVHVQARDQPGYGWPRHLKKKNSKIFLSALEVFLAFQLLSMICLSSLDHPTL